MTQELQTSIAIRLKSKISKKVIDIFNDDVLFRKYAAELELAINKYNSIKNNGHKNLDILINTNHLLNIWDDVLPQYKSIIDRLEQDDDLRNKVFTELSESDYFQVIWQIPNPNYLMLNLMILFYRTSMLCLHPQLREKDAQISSTLEEMAAVIEIEGQFTELFKAIKHWIENWDEEGFSEELYMLVLKL